MAIKTIDIAWLAGLLEGEGCFLVIRGKYPAIAVGMTDEDIIRRVAVMLKTEVSHSGNMYTTQISGFCAIPWMMTLYTLLGKRRREKIAKMIQLWKNTTQHRAPRGMRFMATCHPDKVVHALSLCHTCYEGYRLQKSKWKKEQLLKKVG